MLQQNDRISTLGLEPQYSEYFKERFQQCGLQFVEYGEPADYVICGLHADVWDVDKDKYLNAYVIDQAVFEVLFNVYAQQNDLP
ncbi:hypothetical protein WN093_04610 [Gammaproteobacteria bacterium AS21]